jgi:DinB family protein
LGFNGRDQRLRGGSHIDYTKLTLTDASAALHDIARDAQATFGTLDAQRLNWRPDATRWSVAQCFEHLLTANALMHRNAESALRDPPSSLWQRMPLTPALCGQLLIRTQAPGGTKKYVAPAHAQPTASQIPKDIIDRFVAQQHDLAEWAKSLDSDDAKRAIMLSPFIKIVTYSVLDGFRLLVAHDHRHFEQARRVTQSPGFAGA